MQTKIHNCLGILYIMLQVQRLFLQHYNDSWDYIASLVPVSILFFDNFYCNSYEKLSINMPSVNAEYTFDGTNVFKA